MITFDRVGLRYTLPGGQYHNVFEDLSFHVARGEHVYLTGPTGSGKSSFLRLIYMDALPQQGSVEVAGFASNKVKSSDIPALRRALGVVFQAFQLLDDRSIYDNVAIALHAAGAKRADIRRRTLSALGRVGLTHRRAHLPDALSGGEQQRAAIARAIVNEPRLLLADEPTGNLDPGVAQEIMQLLLRFNMEGMTLLMATHDYGLIRSFPARTLYLNQGQLNEVDPNDLPG